MLCFVVALQLLGCVGSRSDSGASPVASATAAVAMGTTNPANASISSVSGQGDACLVDHSQPVRDTAESRVVDPISGKSTIRVGAAPESKAVPVSLGDLTASPEQFVGQLIRIEGKVTAMCGHRRAWFAVANADAPSAEAVRVITAPRFLVPANSIGKTAHAEGIVEVREISKQTAEHIAKEHGLASPARPVALLQANSAEFF